MCVLHKLTPGIDDGPIIAYEEFIYPPFRKPSEYMAFYEEMNFNFLSNVLEKMIKGVELKPLAQPEYLSSYWPRLKADVNGWINWNWTAQEIERFICAFDDPYDGARARLNGEIVILKNTYYQAVDGYTHPFQNGIIYRDNGKWINVAVQGGELLVCDLQNKLGKRPQFKVGDRLYSTHEDISNGKSRWKKIK